MELGGIPLITQKIAVRLFSFLHPDITAHLVHVANLTPMSNASMCEHLPDLSEPRGGMGECPRPRDPCILARSLDVAHP